MKIKFKLLLPAILCGLSISSLLRAEDQPASVQSMTPGEKPSSQPSMNSHQILQKLSERLNLTDDQKAALGRIFQAREDQINALAKDASLSADERREERDYILKSTGDKIRTLLTREQVWKYYHLSETRPEPVPQPGIKFEPGSWDQGAAQIPTSN